MNTFFSLDFWAKICFDKLDEAFGVLNACLPILMRLKKNLTLIYNLRPFDSKLIYNFGTEVVFVSLTSSENEYFYFLN